MKNLIFVAAGVLIAVASTRGGRDATAPADRGSFDFQRCATMSDAQLQDALGEQYKAREADQAQVVRELVGNPPPQVRLAAVYLAGVNRMEKAAQPLAGMIDMRAGNAAANPALPFWADYPAAQALAKIGNPAVPYLIDNLASNDNPVVREQSAIVLKVVMGRAGALSAIDDAATKAGNEARGTRLKAARSLLDGTNAALPDARPPRP